MKRSPLKRKTPLKRGSRLKPVSDKRKAWLREYEAEKRKHIGLIYFCLGCGKELRVGESPDVNFHHPDGRRTREDILNFVVICGPCHKEIHDHPSLAMAKGLLSPRYRKTNDQAEPSAAPSRLAPATGSPS